MAKRYYMFKKCPWVKTKEEADLVVNMDEMEQICTG